MKRKLIFILLFFLVLGFLMAEGGKEQAAESPEGDGVTTVTMATWYSVMEVTKGAMDEFMRIFEAENPGIKIEPIGIPFEQIQQQMMVAVSGGNAPDIIHAVPMTYNAFANMGALENLGNYFTNGELAELPESILSSCRHGDNLFAVPFHNGSIVVLGSKKLLAEAGLPEEIPETWEDFQYAVSKITELGDDIYGFGARTAKHVNSAYWFFPVMWGFGGEFEDSNGNIVYNNPGTVAALNWFKELGAKKGTPTGMGIPETRTLFAQNKVGFIFDGPWMKGVMRNASGLGEDADDDYIVGLFPKAKDGKRYGIANHHLLSVSKQSKVKEEAAKFVKFLVFDERAAAAHYDALGAVPVAASVLNNPKYQDDFTKVFVETAEFANALPSKNSNFTPALEFVANSLQAALLGNDVKKAAEEADQAIKVLYK